MSGSHVLSGAKMVHKGEAMPKRVSADVEMSLRKRIESGEWSKSLRLPNERHLANEYGVARNTVRAAIERICAGGALRREVGRGTFLRRDAEVDFAGIMHRLLGVSPADTIAVRQVVEPKAAAFAAANANVADLEAIVAAHQAAVDALEFEPFEQCDSAFHDLIFVASRNELLAGLHAILRLIRNQDQWLGMKRRSFTADRRSGYCAQHAAIVQALLRRDAEAAEKGMHAHLDSVGRNLLCAA